MAKMNIFGKEKIFEGKRFNTYFTKMTNTETGETKTFNVKFRQSCGEPDLDECPCVIDVPNEKRNLVEKPIIDKDTDEVVVGEDGIVKVSRTIWISGWEMVGPYVDHSLDSWE